MTNNRIFSISILFISFPQIVYLILLFLYSSKTTLLSGPAEFVAGCDDILGLVVRANQVVHLGLGRWLGAIAEFKAHHVLAAQWEHEFGAAIFVETEHECLH